MKVIFFFDVMSPYTYWSWQILKRYRSLWNLSLDFRPIHLGAVLASSGNVTPASVPNKARYNVKDLERNAKWFKLEHEWKGVPSNFLKDVAPVTILLNRLLSELVSDSHVSEDRKWAAVEAAFRMVWEEAKYRKGHEFLAPERSVIIDQILSQANLEKGKEIHKTNTDQAIALGAFGSPTFVIAEEMYFGSDRFEQMAFLQGKSWHGPNPPSPWFSKI